MEVTDQTIEKLENLSKLRIKDKDLMKDNLGSILSFMENLSEVEDVKQVNQSKTIYRKDEIEEKDMEQFLLNNSKVEDRMFKVPKIL